MQTDVPVKPDENARAELAFSVWASDGNQNLRDTAELTGIPYRTIHYYARTRDWSSRLLAQQSPEAERGALMARNRMRMRLLDVEQELYGIITEKRPLRTLQGTIVRTPDGEPVLEYSAPARDRAYAIKLYFEYSLARLRPEDIPQGPRQKTASPIGDGMSVSDT